MEKENSMEFLVDSPRELADQRGTYTYTCPRERTRRIYLEIQIAVGMRAVSFLWPTLMKRPMGRGEGMWH